MDPNDDSPAGPGRSGAEVLDTDATGDRPAYGAVPFWWWDGDRLTEQRLTDQLEALAERGVSGVCFEQKYPHGPPEGPHVEYFSEEWWEYMEHAVRECDRLGLALWIHDETYHHSPPDWKRYWQSAVEDEIEDHPEFEGRTIACVRERTAGPGSIDLGVPADFKALSAAAYPVKSDDTVDIDGAIPLDPAATESGIDGAGDELADADGFVGELPAGDWLLAAVGHRPEGLCRTDRAVVDRIIDRHYGEYEERLGEFLGDTIVGTFHDELFVLEAVPRTDEARPTAETTAVPCDEALLARFEDDHGYDPVGSLLGLFEDIGPRTESIRCDYYDTLVALLEENWFRPLYEFHEEHDMDLAHDNWGRNDLARQTTEYGSFFRTHRWYQVPGYDDGGRFEGVGTRNFFDAKLAASIAACYDRERVWGELFHTTGWGFPPELQLAGLAENYCYGCTIYNKHGLYYSTLGGWYEHAPPDSHFRQPYWEHADDFYDAVTRMSFLFSRGEPAVDAALLYPDTSMHACWRPGAGISEEGTDIDERTRDLAESLYDEGLDHLIVDEASLLDAEIEDGRLRVGGTDVPVFVLGPNVTVSRAVAETAAAFYEQGGMVVAAGRLPRASADAGRDDPELAATLEAVFGPRYEAAVTGDLDGIAVSENDAGGVAVLAGDIDPAKLVGRLDRYVDRDVRTDAPGIYRTHRRIGDRDAYLLLNTHEERRTVDIRLRSRGQPSLWDPLADETEPIHAYDHEGPYTVVERTFEPYEFHVILVERDADPAEPHIVEGSLAEITDLVAGEDAIEVEGVAASAGDQSAVVALDGDQHDLHGAAADAPETVSIEGEWTFDVEPVLDNRFGDFRHPPSDERMGPEVSEFRYRREHASEDGIERGWQTPDASDAPGPDTSVDAPEADWTDASVSYSPQFWRRTGIEGGRPDSTPDDDPGDWELYEFSPLVGKPGTHPDDHGLNGVVSAEFLRSPDGNATTYFWTTVDTGNDRTVDCHVGPGIEELVVEGEALNPAAATDGVIETSITEGSSPILVGVEPGVDTHIAITPTDSGVAERDMAHVPRLRWFYGDDAAFGFDYRPWADSPVGWYRFDLPAGATGFSLPTRGDARVWVDGEEHDPEGDRIELGTASDDPVPVAVRVAHPPGAYGGLAWSDPVAVDTESASVEPGDWADLGLGSYSGLGVYRTTVDLPELDPDARVELDLGEVAVSAAVDVNGTRVGTRFARPFRFDVTDAVREGDNEIRVEVANTVANHFAAETPTRYVYDGQTASGLLGPVQIRIRPTTTLTAER